MNIWIFNENAYAPDMPGGTRHYDFAHELVNRGHDVTIFATSFHHHRHQEMRLKKGEKWKVEIINGVRFVWIRTPPYTKNDWHRVWNHMVFTYRIWMVGKKIPTLTSDIKKPDVIIGSSPHLLTPLAAYQSARFFHIPFVFEVRDLWPQTLIDMGAISPRNPVTLVLKALEKFLYKRSDHIVTLLPLAHEYITTCGVQGEKISWIPNGVDLLRFNLETLAHKDHEGFTVMYLGAHGQANALDVLLDAAKIIQDSGIRGITISLRGDGPEKQNLITHAKKLRLENVIFLPPVQKLEVPKILNESDITVFILNDLPLYKYGISLNKMSDYLAARKPLILAGNPTNNPVNETHCGFSIPPANSNALANAIISLFNMTPIERQEMGQKGREYVEKYNDIKKLTITLEEILNDAIIVKKSCPVILKNE